MPSQRYIPGAPLSTYVHCFWYWEGAPQAHSQEKLLPNGEASIVFNLRDEPIRIYHAQDPGRYDTCGLAVLSGAHSKAFVIDTEQQERVVGIQFRPGGAFPFLCIPASEVENASVDLSELWRGQAGEVREQLLATRSLPSLFAGLERCLLKQLKRSFDSHPAVAYALQQFQRSAHTGRITTVCEQLGLSSRRFIQLFHREVGLTPKVFCRVRRFQQVLETVHGKRDVDWVQVALQCGYYDQSHFIHDFRSFSGITPSEYAVTATLHLNHVPLV